ncbi:MAG: hypothetical protein FD187_2007 [bacterium]|nr:MAG: hypothetical protein FD142_1036 [bacterium]KAF0148321.1 MAG: hypothetical protein FD187_2007 [bacterium]KAF0167782.1 MAG: hypothetical protein FD158_1909 [bacterium]TXT17110.1 MAG: hypothetical protein FD132_2567 [bacterium]
MLNTLEAEYFALRRLILIDAYRKGAITELLLDGHTSLTGANGAGKTSLLRLIPLFYGESPNKLVQGGGVNLSFVQYYLPHTTSFIVFEYSRRGKACMVVLHASRSGESVYYRFIDQPFVLERFRDDSGSLVNGSDLNRHIRKRGEFCSEQITALSDYRAIIQNAVSANREHRTLAANFAFVGSGSRLSHVEKIVTGMFSRVTNFRDIKRMIVSCIVDNKANIRLESSKAAMQDWVREYHAYVAVMGQVDRMRDFQESHLLHEEAARQLQALHTDIARLQQAHETTIGLAKERGETIQREMQLLEDATNARLRDLGSQLGVAEGGVKSLKDVLQALDRQQRNYEKEGMPALARLVDALPQLIENLETKEKREKALLGQSQDLANSYAELRNQRIEAFHALEREKNALKEPIRANAKEADAQVRQVAEEAWDDIAAEFEQQEETLNASKERLAEHVGSLKHAAEHPQPAAKYLEAKEKAQTDLDVTVETANAASKVYEAAERSHQTEVDVFQSIDGQIQEVKAREKQEQAARERLFSLRDAAPGTMLHFLREFRPDWPRDIARVVPEELLLRTDLAPTLVGDDVRSLYGVGLDLSVLDVPSAGDEEALRQKIEASERAIERLQREAKTKEKELEAQSERVRQAKAVTEDKQRVHIQATNAVQSCKTILETAQRALVEDRRQAGFRAQRELKEAQEALEKQKQALVTLKSTRTARRQTHDKELNARLKAIEDQAQAEIAEIDLAITVAKSASDRDLGVLNRELETALQARGVDTDSLEKLHQEKKQAQERLQTARANEAKVGDWRRWLATEWAARPAKESELEKAETEVNRLVDERIRVEKEREVQHGELDKALSQVNQEKTRAEKLHGFVVKRREKLSRWPADPVGPMAKPLRDQDALEADMDRLLKDIQDEEAKAREALAPIKRVFFETPGTTPYQFYDNKRLGLGPDQDNASPFLWLAPLREWFDSEHENVRRLLLSQCRNFASGIHEFHDRLDGFKRKVGIFSKDLQDNMSASTRFRFISSVAVRITTSFDSLEGWDKIKQLNEEYSAWAGKDANDLPGQVFADAVNQVSNWLQGRHTLDVKLDDLLGLEIDIEEVGQPRKTVKDEGQLRDASSNGLSYLILCVVFVGLINKIRAGQAVQLVWALDELRDLDLDNVRVLLDMLADNHIHLISAFPDPEPEILALLKNRYAIQEGRRLATFVQEAAHV